MSRCWAWAAVLALGFCHSVAAETAHQPDEDDFALLQRMSKAVHYLDYEGSIVYAHGHVLEAMRVAHTEQDGYEREQLIALTGAAHQVVRDNYTMTRFQPERKAVSVEERRHGLTSPTLVSFDPDRVAASYDFRSDGISRIAGRVTRKIAIVPKDGLRFGYRLYIDTKYALPLKFDVVDTNGNYVSQLMFTDVRIRHETPESISAATVAHEGVAPAVRAPYDGPWLFRTIPAGFDLEFADRSGDEGEVEHFVFSDGMATISIYVEPDNSPGLKGHQRMGSVGIVGNIVDGHQITVVGEAPLQTLRDLLAGMSRTGDSAQDG